jgi:calcium/proton exchanger cax
MKDKIDIIIGIAIGSITQITLFLNPFMVLCGWITRADVTLLLDDFQITLMFVAVIVVNYLIADGKSRKFMKHAIENNG